MGMGNTPEAADEAPTATAEPETADESKDEPATDATSATSDHPDHVLASEPQSATAGAVTIEVVPLTDDEILEIAFAVTLDVIFARSPAVTLGTPVRLPHERPRR